MLTLISKPINFAVLTHWLCAICSTFIVHLMTAAITDLHGDVSFCSRCAMLCFSNVLLCFPLIAWQCYAMPSFAMLCSADDMLFYAMLFNTPLCHSMLCHGILRVRYECHAMLCYTIQCCAMLFRAMPCFACLMVA